MAGWEIRERLNASPCLRRYYSTILEASNTQLARVLPNQPVEFYKQLMGRAQRGGAGVGIAAGGLEDEPGVVTAS